jgi:hypothetical protein
MADFCGRKWWAWQGLNLRPLRCQHTALRLNPQKSRTFLFQGQGTSGEQDVNRAGFYRTVTAPRIVTRRDKTRSGLVGAADRAGYRRPASFALPQNATAREGVL